MEIKKNQLETIQISKIEVGKTNPRKRFDEQELQELSESVRQYGVLQPILVRPKTKTKFELVCGERRYRASKIAGLESIPCNIRELTDDEAFELQIIENLERKDVHPLDEADAFKKMLDSGRYTIEDVAARLAKTETFVVQRLKLVDLIDDIRADFFSGSLGIGHAVLISRLSPEDQVHIYENSQNWNGGSDYGTIQELKDEIEGSSRNLAEAAFDIEKADLIPGCVACTLCPKSSAANPALFPEFDKNTCFDKSCYEAKEKAHIEIEVNRILTQGEDIVLCAGYNKPSDSVLKLAENYKVEFLKRYDDFKTDSSSPGTTLKEGFFVSGQGAGKYQEIYVYDKVLSKINPVLNVTTTTDGTSVENTEIEAEILRIKIRAKRSLELDKEKIWLKVQDLDFSDKVSNLPLSPEETKASFAAIYGSLPWDMKDLLLKKCLGVDEDYNTANVDELFSKTLITAKMIDTALRILIISVLPQRFGVEDRGIKNIGYFTFANYHRPEEITQIKAAQQEESDKRIFRTNARLEALKSKIEKNENSTQD